MSSSQQQHEQLSLTVHHHNNNNEIKRPSSILEQLTEECVSTFGKLNNSVNKALEQGRKEGFADREVGDMIRTKLLGAGYSRMTISRALPPSAKRLEHANNKHNNNKRQRNKMLRSSASVVNDEVVTSSKETIQFVGKISRTGRLQMIYCPKKLHADIDKMIADKKIRVVITPIID